MPRWIARRAAVAAGMVTIAVPNAAFPPAGDALAQARVVLPSLRELTPDVLEGLNT